MKRTVTTICVLVPFAIAAAASSFQAPAGLTRTDLQRHDISIAGHEAIQTRVEFAPGAVAPWHSHPGEELIYVPEGKLEFQLEGEKPVTLGVGEVLFVPAGKVHMARNPGTTRGIELATYVVEKGKPLLVRANAPQTP